MWFNPFVGESNKSFGGMSANSIYGGRDLTDKYTIEQMYEKVHSGTFEDLYVGDSFDVELTTDIYSHFIGDTFSPEISFYEASGTINERTWAITEDDTPQNGKIYATKLTVTETVPLMFAGFNYYMNLGDPTPLTDNHAILIPKNPGFITLEKMNAVNNTIGGYYNSDMHQLTLPCYAKSLKTALGGHLLTHRSYLSNAVNDTWASRAGALIKGSASSAVWADTELQLMSEQQVYGTEALTSAPYDVGIDYKQLPVFNFINPMQFGRGDQWLRTVGNTRWFAACSSSGFAGGKDAHTANYVRPIIIFG